VGAWCHLIALHYRLTHEQGGGTGLGGGFNGKEFQIGNPESSTIGGHYRMLPPQRKTPGLAVMPVN
jgi:hypothetical protein